MTKFHLIGAALSLVLLAGCAMPTGLGANAGAGAAAGTGAGAGAGATAGGSAAIVAPAIGEDIKDSANKYGAWLIQYTPTYKKGTKWTFDMKYVDFPSSLPKPPDGEMTKEVTEIVGGKAKIKQVTSTPQGPKEETVEESIPSVDAPSTPGGSMPAGAAMKYMGTEQLQTAAGTYESVKLEMTIPANGSTPAMTLNMWMGKGVGIIKALTPVSFPGPDGQPVSFKVEQSLKAFVAGS